MNEVFGKNQRAAEALGREAERYLDLVASLREEQGDDKWLPATQPEWLERAVTEAA